MCFLPQESGNGCWIVGWHFFDFVDSFAEVCDALKRLSLYNRLDTLSAHYWSAATLVYMPAIDISKHFTEN